MKVDPTLSHPARLYDYYLGGVTNFSVDRQVAERLGSAYPGGIETVRAVVRSNRDFLRRVVRWLVREEGVRQFLDIGSGIPHGDNVHSVTRMMAPGCKVIYVDNDPIVLAHAQKLLERADDNAVGFVAGDLREPASLVAQVAGMLDFSEPVAVLLLGVLDLLPGTTTDGPYRHVAELVDALALGSHLAVCHLASDLPCLDHAELAWWSDDALGAVSAPRSLEAVCRFFERLTLVEPGVVQVDRWRPDYGPGPVRHAKEHAGPFYAGLARKW